MFGFSFLALFVIYHMLLHANSLFIPFLDATSLYKHITIYLPILLLMDIRFVSSFRSRTRVSKFFL